MVVERRFGSGLRGRLIMVLTVAFTIAFGLLSLAATQLDKRRQADELARAAQQVGEIIAIQTGASPTEVSFDRAIIPLLANSKLEGAALQRPDGQIFSRGKTSESPSGTLSLTGGAELRVWLKPGPRTNLSNPLLLYVGVTGAAILLLMYIFLTYLIVRPVDALRVASERLARGRLEARVPVRGATEVANLSTAFNEMAEQLRADRVALQNRLDELERTTAELVETQDHLIRTSKLAAVGQLSAGVAHEIGNPLAAIQGLLQLLQGGELQEEEAKEFIDRVGRETERIHATIRDLLDFARQESPEEGGGSSDLSSVIEDTLRLVKPQNRFEGIRIEARLRPGTPSVRGSSDRLGQLLLNLLFNAADAMQGKGEISIEADIVTETGEVAVRVKDTGPGIDEKVIEQVFDPFFTTKPAGKGTGLGLAVCQQLVSRLGGSIAVRNVAGGGACFEVRLPAAT